MESPFTCKMFFLLSYFRNKWNKEKNWNWWSDCTDDHVFQAKNVSFLTGIVKITFSIVLDCIKSMKVYSIIWIHNCVYTI